MSRAGNTQLQHQHLWNCVSWNIILVIGKNLPEHAQICSILQMKSATVNDRHKRLHIYLSQGIFWSVIARTYFVRNKCFITILKDWSCLSKFSAPRVTIKYLTYKRYIASQPPADLMSSCATSCVIHQAWQSIASLLRRGWKYMMLNLNQKRPYGIDAVVTDNLALNPTQQRIARIQEGWNKVHNLCHW